MTLRDVQLPSGATLRIQPARFSDARALLTAITAEFRRFEFSSDTDVAAVFKELACIAFSSPAVTQALWKCMEGCFYVAAGTDVPVKIAESVFEAVERREDFVKVCTEVAKENVGPFMKSLSAWFSKAQEALGGGSQGSGSQTTTSSSTSGSAAAATPPP